MIDFHSHLLPGIDDGSKNVKMSVAMLQESKMQEVEICVATPHFYFDNDLEKIVQKREKSYKKLIAHLEKQGIEVPEIVLGFEVYLSSEIIEQPDLDSLLIKETNTMLIEMPYKKWDDNIFKRLEFLVEKDYDIVIAHPERYHTVCGKDEYDRLFSYGCVGQFNAASLINPNTRNITYSLIKEGKVKLMGSDAHNISTRANFIAIASEFIRKNLGEEVLNTMKYMAELYLGRR